MNLEKNAKNWNTLANHDPFWTVLTDLKSGADSDEFFRTGVENIAGLETHLKTKKIKFGGELALDFGSGLGRLTQALCKSYNNCIGVDISEVMVQKATEFNRYGKRCKYVVNTMNDLSIFSDETFDLIHSDIVLQHIDVDDIIQYINEFFRISKKNGLIIFGLPYKPTIRKFIKNTLKKVLPETLLNIYRVKMTGTSAFMNMNWLPEKIIRKIGTDNGAVLLDEISIRHLGYYSYKYIFRKVK